MPYTSNWTGGLDNNAALIQYADGYKLKPEEKKPFIFVSAAKANDVLFVDLAYGEAVIITNAGENAAYIQNNEDDEGAALQAGEVAVVLSWGENGVVLFTLNASGGGD